MIQRRAHSKAADGRCRQLLVSGIIIGMVTFVPSARGETIVLGTSGWQVSWDSSLDNFVDIVVDAIIGDTLFIQKSAEFTQGPGPDGLFPTIPITFAQIDADAVTTIAINDEIITNSTGFDWTDFHFELLDGDDAVFDEEATNGSAGGAGFSTFPFDNQMFSDAAMSFWVDGFGLGNPDALVEDGTQWFPGDGAFDGELYIDLMLGAGTDQDPFTVFSFKETPTPEPTTLIMLLVGGLLALRPARDGHV